MIMITRHGIGQKQRSDKFVGKTVAVRYSAVSVSSPLQGSATRLPNKTLKVVAFASRSFAPPFTVFSGTVLVARAQTALYLAAGLLPQSPKEWC
jgi:hypothetical protein